MECVEVTYEEAKLLIREGDVLLFKGASFSSGWIKWAGSGPYSHVGMASRVIFDEQLIIECVEFREWKGGRTVNLEHYLHKQDGVRIDVYRMSETAQVLRAIVDESKSPRVVVVQRFDFQYNGYAAVYEMRKLTGLPYGWKRIWLMASYHIPLLRFMREPAIEDKSENGKLYPVCSTAVAAAIRRTFVDLVPNLADHEVTPSHLARSTHLHYLFSIKSDGQ